MYPLTSQVHIATDIARGVAARLAGMEPPEIEQNEQTFAQLCERIDRTIEFLKGIRPEQMADARTRSITRPTRAGTHTFTGINYLVQFGTPNVFFHATTAYDILRHNGVEIGKADFLGQLD